MQRAERPIRKGTELVKLSAALYRELALSALQLLPLQRMKPVFRAARIRPAKQAWV